LFSLIFLVTLSRNIDTFFSTNDEQVKDVQVYTSDSSSLSSKKKPPILTSKTNQEEKQTSLRNTKDNSNKRVVSKESSDNTKEYTREQKGQIPAKADTSGTLKKAKKERELVFCGQCRWDPNVRNQFCAGKVDFAMRRLSREEAVAEISTRHPYCLVPAVKLVPNTVNSFKDLPKRGIEGTWVQDWEYSNRTDYINHEEQSHWGFPDDGYRKTIPNCGSSYRWEDFNSPVTEISLNGFCQVASELNVTRLLIVGDSMSQNFHKSLVSLLHIAPKYYAGLFKRDAKVICQQNQMVTIKYLRVTKLDEILSLSTPSYEIEHHPVSDYSDFIETNPNRTAVIINIGAHMKDIDMYKVGFHSVLSWLDERKIKDPSQILAFYRDTVPGHPECLPSGPKKEGNDKNSFNKTLLETIPYSNYAEYREATNTLMQKAKLNQSNIEWPWYWYQHANGTFETYNAYSQKVLGQRPKDKFQVHWLNVYNSTILRHDRHQGFGDCLHYRFPGPGDWWVHLFYSALLDLAGVMEED
jgi:hypothetical protein